MDAKEKTEQDDQQRRSNPLAQAMRDFDRLEREAIERAKKERSYPLKENAYERFYRIHRQTQERG